MTIFSKLLFPYLFLSYLGNCHYTWQYQIGESKVDFNIEADFYDVDMFDTSTNDIEEIRALGKTSICYIDFGTMESWRVDANTFPDAVLGNDNGWPGERWLDIRSPEVAAIMQARIALAAAKNCMYIEADNVDEYTNTNSGFPLTYNDQLKYNKWIASEVHLRGMKVALKNNQDQVNDLLNDFNMLITEQCVQYNQCEQSIPFLNQGLPVLDVEYIRIKNFCNLLNSLNISGIYKKQSLNAKPYCSCLLNKC